jgi:hypothetical protein
MFRDLVRYDVEGKRFFFAGDFCSAVSDLAVAEAGVAFETTMPGWVIENQTLAKEPYDLRIGKGLTLQSALVTGADTTCLQTVWRYFDLFGELKSQPPPMTDAEAMALADETYLDWPFLEDRHRQLQRALDAWCGQQAFAHAGVIGRDEIVEHAGTAAGTHPPGAEDVFLYDRDTAQGGRAAFAQRPVRRLRRVQRRLGGEGDQAVEPGVQALDARQEMARQLNA